MAYAAESGGVGIIDSMLGAMAGASAVSAEGRTALALAASSGHLAAAPILTVAGVHPVRPSDAEGVRRGEGISAFPPAAHQPPCWTAGKTGPRVVAVLGVSPGVSPEPERS